MIKLSSKRVLIRQPDGTKCPVELDALRADLEKSLVTAGVAEHWIADHVLGMVETLVTEGSVVAGGEAGLDRTISKILIDAGYPGRGRQLCRLPRRGESVPGDQGPATL